MSPVMDKHNIYIYNRANEVRSLCGIIPTSYKQYTEPQDGTIPRRSYIGIVLKIHQVLRSCSDASISLIWT